MVKCLRASWITSWNYASVRLQDIERRCNFASLPKPSLAWICTFWRVEFCFVAAINSSFMASFLFWVHTERQNVLWSLLCISRINYGKLHKTVFSFQTSMCRPANGPRNGNFWNGKHKTATRIDRKSLVEAEKCAEPGERYFNFSLFLFAWLRSRTINEWIEWKFN